jgi:hypothetical protein
MIVSFAKNKWSEEDKQDIVLALRQFKRENERSKEFLKKWEEQNESFLSKTKRFLVG